MSPGRPVASAPVLRYNPAASLPPLPRLASTATRKSCSAPVPTSVEVLYAAADCTTNVPPSYRVSPPAAIGPLGRSRRVASLSLPAPDGEAGPGSPVGGTAVGAAPPGGQPDGEVGPGSPVGAAAVVGPAGGRISKYQ